MLRLVLAEISTRMVYAACGSAELGRCTTDVTCSLAWDRRDLFNHTLKFAHTGSLGPEDY
jgi:hypothetical protein